MVTNKLPGSLSGDAAVICVLSEYVQFASEIKI